MIPPIVTLATSASPVKIKEDRDISSPPLSQSIVHSLPESSNPHRSGHFHELSKVQHQELISALRRAADNHERCAKILTASARESSMYAIELREQADILEHALPDPAEEVVSGR